MPLVAPTQSYGLGIAEWLTSLITVGSEAGFDIAKSRFGVPPPGTFTQTTSEGTTVQRAAEYPGFALSTFPPTSFSPVGGDIMKWGLIAVGVVVVVSILKK